MPVVTMEEMIKEVENKADAVEANKEYWRNNTDICSSDEDRASMVKMCEADADDMRAGAELMRQGKFLEAYDKFSYMDTSAREQVPDNAWEYCQDKSEEHCRKKREERMVEREVELTLTVRVKTDGDNDENDIAKHMNVTATIPSYIGDVMTVSTAYSFTH